MTTPYYITSRCEEKTHTSEVVLVSKVLKIKQLALNVNKRISAEKNIIPPCKCLLFSLTKIMLVWMITMHNLKYRKIQKKTLAKWCFTPVPPQRGEMSRKVRFVSVFQVKEKKSWYEQVTNCNCNINLITFLPNTDLLNSTGELRTSDFPVQTEHSIYFKQVCTAMMSRKKGLKNGLKYEIPFV